MTERDAPSEQNSQALTDPRFPPYLARQVHEIPVETLHPCACLTDAPGGPVGQYIADASCRECEGLGVIVVPAVTDEGRAIGAEALAPGHPALTRETFIPDRDAGA